MNKFSYSLEKLLKKLQVAEGLIKKPIVALVTKKCSTSKSKGKKKKKNSEIKSSSLGTSWISTNNEKTQRLVFSFANNWGTRSCNV